MNLGNVTAVCLGAVVGWRLARFFRLPVSLRTWLLLVAAVLVGSFVGVRTWLVRGFGLDIRLNWAIASCCLGVLAGLLARTRRNLLARG